MSFPLELPWPQQLYAWLLVITLVVHMGCVSYVMGGLLWLVGDRRGRALSAPVSDWLPFALGVAITAGVAPFLFAQVLYAHPMYTSHVLDPLRWFALVPVLAAGFYMLYLQKLRWFANRPALQRAVRIAAWVLFAGVGWGWSASHQLSMAPEAWPRQYQTLSVYGADAITLSRLGCWLGAMLGCFGALAVWQRDPEDGVSDRALRWYAVVGCAVAVGGGVSFLERSGAILPLGVRVTFLVGVIGQAALWVAPARLRSGRARWLLTSAAFATLFAMAVGREGIRADALGLQDRSFPAFDVGGFVVFAVFFAINTAVIAAAIVAVRRLPTQPDD